jgi:Icc-related predicted phosphoesterase
MKLRIGLVADIHAGTTRSNIKSTEAIGLLEAVVAEANTRSIDLFVTLGDNINATSAEEDFQYLRQVRQVLARLEAPVVPLFGNNDLKFLDAQRAANALECNPGSEVRQVNGWTFVFWRPACDLSFEHGLLLEESDLSWLRSALATAPTTPGCRSISTALGYSMPPPQ